jgi:hypothetical protein
MRKVTFYINDNEYFYKELTEKEGVPSEKAKEIMEKSRIAFPEDPFKFRKHCRFSSMPGVARSEELFSGHKISGCRKIP